jgi:hypothetical protein
LRHLEAGFGRQAFDRLGKAQAFRAHDEIEVAAMGAATEAVEEALVLADRKRRRLFIVEGTQPAVLATLATQLDAPADEIDKRHSGAYFVKKVVGKFHLAGFPCTPATPQPLATLQKTRPWRLA